MPEKVKECATKKTEYVIQGLYSDEADWEDLCVEFSETDAISAVDLYWLEEEGAAKNYRAVLDDRVAYMYISVEKSDED